VTVSLAHIYRYPLKSGQPNELRHADLEPWGLAGDRRWMIVDDGGTVVTAREHPRLLWVSALLDGSALRLRTPGRAELTVKAPPGGTYAPVQLWQSSIDVVPAGDDAHTWFSEVLGLSVRLVYLDDPRRGRPNLRDPRPGRCAGRPPALT
jgi:uncharacterized protein YcbX